MQVRCPYCSAVFEAARAGVQACPTCHRQIQIPAAPAGALPPTDPITQGGGFAVEPPVVPTAAPPGTGFVPPPPGGPGSPPPPGSGTPWERRRELGIPKAFFETWKQCMFAPESFWASVHPQGLWIDSLTYAWIVAAIAAVVQLPFSMFQASQSRRMLEQMQDIFRNIPAQYQQYVDMFRSMTGAGGDATTSIMSGLGLLIAFPLVILIASAIIHLSCMLFGCAKNGYWATFRVCAYAVSPQVFRGIPCLGALAGIYGLVLAILGLAKVQETTTGKAAAAVLVIPALLVCCCCGLVASLIGAATHLGK